MGTAGEWLPDEVLLAGLGAEDAEMAVAFVRHFQRVIFGEDVAQQAGPRRRGFSINSLVPESGFGV